MQKKLYKISAQRKVSGVCAGFAEYLNVDVTVVRIIALLLILFSLPIGLIFYIACAFIMPDKNEII